MLERPAREESADRPGTPPADFGALVAALPPPCRGLYDQIRTAVDELEATVSWELLYYPPDDTALLVERLQELVASIRRLPPRLASCLPGFASPEREASSEPLREEVEFYFDSVLHTVSKDRDRLQTLLDELAAPQAADAERIQRLCELAADLKGKFASSIMDATAALVSQGRWPSLRVEPILFPEKAEEICRSHELVAALRGLCTLLEELPQRVPLATIVARWRDGQRADQYAFADLVVLRGQLGALLGERARRALYSGDHHQIRLREVRLAERVGEIETLHRRCWGVPAGAAAALIAEQLPRLEQLACEIAALTDVEQLKSLIGEKAVAGLRGRVVPGRDEPSEPLVGLLAHDDLRLFFASLHAAVQRRAALAAGDRLSGGAAAAPAEPLPAPIPAAPTPSAAMPPAERAALLADLRDRVGVLESPLNPRWNDFRMVLRMLARHGRLPDAMTAASLPLVEELVADVTPRLRRLAPHGGLTADLVERIEETCRALLAEPLAAVSGEATRQRLERLQRFLAALETVLAS